MRVITFYNEIVNPQFAELQKKVFNKFGYDIDQIYVKNWVTHGKAVDDYLLSINDENEDFDVNQIVEVKGHDRLWAETFLAKQLEIDKRNPRAVVALEKLRAIWVIPSLKFSCMGMNETDPYFVLVQKVLTDFSAIKLN